MTRLPDGVTRPGQKRLATSMHGDLVLVLTDRTVTMKPKGSRVNGIVVLTWGAVYQRAVEAEIAAKARAKRAARRQGRRA